MFRTLALFGLLGLSAASIKDCDPSSVFRPTDLALYPDPPIRGEPVYMTVKFQNPGPEVTEGKVTTAIALNGIPVATVVKPLCEDTVCPITVGLNDRSTSTVWPDTVSGRVSSKIHWTNAGGNSLLCVQTAVSVSAYGNTSMALTTPLFMADKHEHPPAPHHNNPPVPAPPAPHHSDKPAAPPAPQKSHHSDGPRHSDQPKSAPRHSDGPKPAPHHPSGPKHAPHHSDKPKPASGPGHAPHHSDKPRPRLHPTQAPMPIEPATSGTTSSATGSGSTGSGSTGSGPTSGGTGSSGSGPTSGGTGSSGSGSSGSGSSGSGPTSSVTSAGAGSTININIGVLFKNIMNALNGNGISQRRHLRAITQLAESSDE